MKREPARPTSKAPAERFTGDVWVDLVPASQELARYSAGLVRFAPGARGAWHAHAQGQTLHVFTGVAVVQDREGHTVLAAAGETIHTPPGEWHWHGATTDEPMTHLALSAIAPAEEGTSVTWGEHVTDDEYQAALRHATE